MKTPPAVRRCPWWMLLAWVPLVLARGAEPPPAARADALLARWDRTDSPGAAVVVVRNGTVVYARGCGVANLETGSPITTNTVFDVASVAKQFTGLGIAVLLQEGRLKLDDDIRRHLPDVPDFGRPIRLRDLLHHTSGLRDWPETLSFSGLSLEGPIRMDMILEMVRRQRELDFLPGAEHQYSNTGYNLLAALVTRVTGQPFSHFMKARVFAPLGMTNTHFCDDPSAVVANRAESYAAGGRERIPSQLAAPGSSSLFTTAADLGRWLANFDSAEVGGRPALDAMMRPGQLNNGQEVRYGFGLALGRYRGTPVADHTGGWAGYRSAVLLLPEKRFTVGILGNAADLDTLSLARAIADVYLGDQLDEPPKANPPSSNKAAAAVPADWEGCLGTYRAGPDWWLTVSRAGDALMVQASREARFPLTPLSAGRFYVEAYGAEIAFERSGGEAASHLLYRGLRAPRVTFTSPPPDYLAEFAGDYASAELVSLARLAVREGSLEAWHPTLGWRRLTPWARDRFDLAGGVSADFARDADGRVTELRLSGGRVRHLRFVRADPASWGRASSAE